jgi:hypothetical protein
MRRQSRFEISREMVLRDGQSNERDVRLDHEYTYMFREEFQMLLSPPPPPLLLLLLILLAPQQAAAAAVMCSSTPNPDNKDDDEEEEEESEKTCNKASIWSHTHS